jgi:hypothetical protein
MTEVFVLLAIVAIVATAVFAWLYSLARSDVKGLKEAVRNVQERSNYWSRKASAAEDRNRELRKVLAVTILKGTNYLGIDPATFDELPEDFAIFKSTDPGTDGDSTIVVYQVGPVSAGGIELKNQIL